MKTLTLVCLGTIFLVLVQADKKPLGNDKKPLVANKGAKNNAVIKLAPGHDSILEEVRIGPDGRPLLFGPNIELCKKSK